MDSQPIKPYRILTINPGSTSTKIAFFEDDREVFKTAISHTEQDLRRFSSVSDQHEFRLRIVHDTLKENNIAVETIHAVVGRGGLLRPIPSGTYRVNERMLEDLTKAKYGKHAANLGALIAHEIGREAGVPAYIVDPSVTDELKPVARISGMPELERLSKFHALNQKAVARWAAQKLGKRYDEVNLIVAHLGGGISVGAHRRGRVVDVNNAFNGDGPFAPERAGGLPSGQLVDLCLSGKYSKKELKNRIVGKAGMMAYLGTRDLRRVKEMIESGDEKARLIYEAMAYEVAKEIGSCAAVLEGKVDGIVLTGGLTYDEAFTAMIRMRIEWIAEVFISSGEREMEALARGALRVLEGEEEAKVY